MAEKLKTRFKLLPYQILGRRWLVPSILIIPAGFAFNWGIAQIPEFDTASPVFGWIITIVGVLLTLYSILATQSKVLFYKDHFTLWPPIHPMAISYKRIKFIHPIEFSMGVSWLIQLADRFYS